MSDHLSSQNPTKSGFKSRESISRLKGALTYSLDGLTYAWKYEAAFRQEIKLFILMIVCMNWVWLRPWQSLALLGSMGLVLVIELLNSALEALADRLTSQFDPAIKAAKDLGSAAVFLVLIWTIVLWVVWVLLPLIQEIKFLLMSYIV